MADVFERVKAALGRRYAVEHEIGAGGMATVYAAHAVALFAEALSPGESAVLAAVAAPPVRAGSRACIGLPTGRARST